MFKNISKFTKMSELCMVGGTDVPLIHTKLSCLTDFLKSYQPLTSFSPITLNIHNLNQAWTLFHVVGFTFQPNRTQSILGIRT